MPRRILTPLLVACLVPTPAAGHELTVAAGGGYGGVDSGAICTGGKDCPERVEGGSLLLSVGYHHTWPFHLTAGCRLEGLSSFAHGDVAGGLYAVGAVGLQSHRFSADLGMGFGHFWASGDRGVAVPLGLRLGLRITRHLALVAAGMLAKGSDMVAGFAGLTIEWRPLAHFRPPPD